MSAKDVLTTYAKLHQGKVGQHWLWAAIERVVAGDDEAEVMRDFGFSRTHYLDSLQSDLQGMFKCYWGLRELFDQKAGELAKVAEQRDELLAAIQQTLDENSHLADGDDCTLIVLKRALEKVGAGGTGDAIACFDQWRGLAKKPSNDITQGSDHSERPAGAEG